MLLIVIIKACNASLSQYIRYVETICIVMCSTLYIVKPLCPELIQYICDRGLVDERQGKVMNSVLWSEYCGGCNGELYL